MKKFNNGIYLGGKLGFTSDGYKKNTIRPYTELSSYFGFLLGYKNYFNDRFGFFVDYLGAFALVETKGSDYSGTCMCGVDITSIGGFITLSEHNELALTQSWFTVNEKELTAPGISYRYLW